ncbi:translation initiation factor IF-3 [Paenibacillus antri]|uniref:Translation initiation factor IF-3 n=1 Tax=Paenibacillus antri TaxID=2582848 RepID=A0A5R9GLX5_9BACL|nr:translation initiation factor IF-3 [Paenibacillus antri]TLS52875.1 translation initiation factor IF-3 [Paenibacillus antri]
MIKNEKIKASEVALTGVDGENLGVMKTTEALALAKKLKVDLVCESLFSSPPPCRLIGAGAARDAKQQEKRKERAPKVKEIRLTPTIEAHDFDTKKTQAERILKGGDAALFVVKLSGAKEGEAAKRLLEDLIKELAPFGAKKTGIQLSGKQAAVQLDPKAD